MQTCCAALGPPSWLHSSLPNLVTRAFSPRSTPRACACAFVVPSHSLEEFPLSVCSRGEKVKLRPTQLTSVFRACMQLQMSSYPPCCAFTGWTPTSVRVHRHVIILLPGREKVVRSLERQRMGKHAFSSRRWTDTTPHPQGLGGDHTETNHPTGMWHAGFYLRAQMDPYGTKWRQMHESEHVFSSVI